MSITTYAQGKTYKMPDSGYLIFEAGNLCKRLDTEADNMIFITLSN
jgi:hypothetical protein